MKTSELLSEIYGRLPELVRHAVDGLDADDLCAAPVEGANTIGWLVWHLTRVQDHHVAELIGEPQVWVTQDWGPRFGVESDAGNTGYGHDADEMASVRPTNAAVTVAYFDAVFARTREYIATLTDTALDRVVDTRWDPPVTLGVRLVSVADDSLQHAGQAAYAKGLLT